MIKKILVSQPKPTSEKSPYFEIASKYGVEVVFRPFIKIEGLSAKEFRQQKVSILDYTAVVFTSRNAIDHFFLLQRITCDDTRRHEIFLHHGNHCTVHPEICAVPQTQSILQFHGQNAKKLIHKEVVMYRTVSNDFKSDEKFDYDMLIFFSPSGIQALLKNFPKFEQKDIAIGTFGPATAQAVKDAGLRLDMEAPTSQYPSITAALDDFVKKHNC